MRSILVLLASVLLAAGASLAASSPPDVAPPTGWLGLGFLCDKDPDTGDAFLIVMGTAPEGPAQRAGIQPQDLITSMNGKPISCRDQLESVELFQSLEAGEEVAFVLLRGGGEKTVKLVAARMSPEQEQAWLRHYRELWLELRVHE